MLAACDPAQLPEQVLARQCLPVSGIRPLTLDVLAPGKGILHVQIEQRGISVAGSLEGTDAAASVVERFGTITLAVATEGQRRHTVRIVSRDSKDITGEVCVSGFLLDPEDHVRVRAVHAFASADQAIADREWRLAFRELATAARGFDRLGARHQAAAARHEMAELAYRRLNRFRDGSVLASRALEGFGRDADPGLRSAVLALQAKLLLELPGAAGGRERALHLFALAEQYANHSPHGAREIPRIGIMRGFISYIAGRTAESSEFFSEAAGQCAAMGDWECYARAHQNLAALAEETRSYAVALQAYADALKRLDPQVAPEMIADIQGNYGRLQSTVGLFTQAEQSLLSAIRFYSELGDCDGARRNLARLGTILVQVGSISEATAYLKRAASLGCADLLSMRERQSNGNDISATLSRFADGAAAISQETRETSCPTPPPVNSLSAAGKFAVFHALMALSDVAMLEDRHDDAALCLALASPYAATPRTRLRLANATGVLYLQRSEAARARETFERGLAEADEAGVPETYEHRAPAYLGLGRAALLEGRTQEARRYASRALLLSSMRADVGQIVDSLQLLAQGLRDSKDHAGAVRTYRTAVRLIEQVPIGELDGEKRATFLATQHAVFAELMDLLLQDGKAQANDGSDEEASVAWAAFKVAERGRARSLRHAINQATLDDLQTAREPASARYQNLMREIARLARSGLSADELGASIDELSSLPLEDDRAIAELQLADLQRRLDHLDATVVEYAAGRNRMFAFVGDGEGVRVVPLGERREIAEAVADLYELLRSHESAELDVQKAAARVARLAFWPVSEHLHRRRIIFVPDDSLHSVPFAVLPWSPGEDAPLVVQRAEVSTMPSALFMTRFPEERLASSAGSRLAFIGDPVFRAEEWQRECQDGSPGSSRGESRQARGLSDWVRSLPRLPGTREEVLSIARLARRTRPSSQVDVQLGCAATVRALRRVASHGTRLLHVATHGYVDANRPRLSALALAYDPSATDHGTTFGLLDILGLRLDSPLVVLSACDMSRGRLLPGEGVLGPAPAFLQAGAASVVASYWRVEDEATAAFMQRFYSYLLEHGLPAAAALRRAQLDQLSGSSRVWAAFALHGWPDASI